MRTVARVPSSAGSMLVCLSGDPLLPAILRASLFESAASTTVVVSARSGDRVPHVAVPQRVANAAVSAVPFASSTASRPWLGTESPTDGDDGGPRREPSFQSIMPERAPIPKVATSASICQSPSQAPLPRIVGFVGPRRERIMGASRHLPSVRFHHSRTLLGAPDGRHGMAVVLSAKVKVKESPRQSKVCDEIERQGESSPARSHVCVVDKRRVKCFAVRAVIWVTTAKMGTRVTTKMWAFEP